MNWRGRIGWIEITVLAALLLGVVGFWAIGEVVERTVNGNSLDVRLLLAFRQPGNLAVPIGPAWGQTVARDITALGGGTVLVLLTAVLTIYLLLEGRRLLALFIFVSVAGGGVVSIILKETWNRPRPSVVPHLTSISQASFPSGHSLLSSVTYFTLAALVTWTTPRWRTKIFLLTAAGVLVALIGISRVYLGVHYPTDVLAGWCVGITWAVGCCFVAHVVEARRRKALAKSQP